VIDPLGVPNRPGIEARPRPRSYAYGPKPWGDLDDERRARERHDALKRMQARALELSQDTAELEAIVAGDEATIVRVIEGIERPPAEAPGVTSAPSIDAADLLALDLPPLRWIVPDLLPEGTTILAAPPKVGKSCLVYQVAVESAIGGELFGRRVSPGSVLYLALEDGARRGQDRLRAALEGRTMPRGRLEVRWGAPNIGAGLEDLVSGWLDAHPDASMVAIDTLGRVRPRSDGRRNAYAVDVEDLAKLQNITRERSVALVVVHHARKETGDDFLASVSGSYGITGSADTIIAVRRARLESFGSILVTGRDVPDAELAARFDGLLWHEAPQALAAASFERAEVYQTIVEAGPLFPQAIADRLGKTRQSVAYLVEKLVAEGAVTRVAKGYAAVHREEEPSRSRAYESLPPSAAFSERKGRQGGYPRAPAREEPIPFTFEEDPPQ
jgi:hypothetical protein